MTREDVYHALDSERNYQDIRWAGSAGSQKSGMGALDRTLDEFALYIRGYAEKLATIASHTDDPNEKLDHVRKVGALCVSCMEAHGAPHRQLIEVTQ